MPPDTAGRSPGTRSRVVVTADGPVLVEGPVEVELPDGRRVASDRPVVALCVCGNSRRAPFCDTSHRRRVRSASTTTPAPAAVTTPVPMPEEGR